MNILKPQKRPPMPPVKPPLLSFPDKMCDVEIYFTDGTFQKYFDVLWVRGTEDQIILSKNKKTWYFMKSHIKYIMREETKAHDEADP